MIIAGIIIALYLWAFLNVELRSSISDSLLVSTPAAIVAGATLLISFISYLWVPKKYLAYTSTFIYLLIATMTALLILSTGGLASPFIALWIVIAIFAGLFGFAGFGPLLLAVNVYLVSQVLNGSLIRGDIATLVLVGEIPLLASLFLWHKRAEEEVIGDEAARNKRRYTELGTELSEVADSSEVIIDAIGDGVIAVDSQGVIQIINPAAEKLLGWSKSDALSLNYKSVLQLVDDKGNEVSGATDPVQESLNTNQQARTSHLTAVTKADKRLFVSVVASPVGQAGSGTIVVFRDITSEVAEEREQAEFISTASHEMRTPVASIEGYLGLALNPNTATIDDKARDYIEKAHESARHLGRLFQDLLDVSKSEDGRLSNNPQVVDVVAYGATIIEGLQHSAAAKGLKLTYKPAPNTADTGDRRLSPVYYVNLDNDHIRELISNLTENAIKYTPSGEVSVDITGDNERITISVSDTGVGIPSEDISHLFQKFYRVDNSDTREIGGTGLGLYLCRRLAETMGGRIWVESEYQKGSTFFVELPRISNQEAQQLLNSAAQQREQAAQNPTQPTSAPESTPEPAMPRPHPEVPSTVVTPVAAPQPSPAAPAGPSSKTAALSREQIAEYVRRQQALVAQEQAHLTPPTPAPVQQVTAPPAPQYTAVAQAGQPLSIEQLSPQQSPQPQPTTTIPVQYTQPAVAPASGPTLSSIERDPAAYQSAQEQAIGTRSVPGFPQIPQR